MQGVPVLVNDLGCSISMKVRLGLLGSCIIEIFSRYAQPSIQAWMVVTVGEQHDDLGMI